MSYTEYQKQTIKKIVNNFLDEDSNIGRIIDADEVGLGKTYVAKGVIHTMAYRAYCDWKEEQSKQNNEQQNNKSTQEQKSEFEYSVMYLCSNLNIAGQNKVKLGLKPEERKDGQDSEKENNQNSGDKSNQDDYGKITPVENRLTMMYLQKLRNGTKISAEQLHKEYTEIFGDENIPSGGLEGDQIKITILPATPKTSMRIQGKGHAQEREFILRVLRKMGISKELSSEILKNNRGVRYSDEITDNPSEGFKKEEFDELREGFTNTAELESLLKEIKEYEEKIKSIYGEYKDEYADDENKFNPIQKRYSSCLSEWQNRWGKLRLLFAKATLKCMKYDLVIMDEFQNFNDILKAANIAASKRDAIHVKQGEKETEPIIEKIFVEEDDKSSKILMLSATPFRMYLSNENELELEETVPEDSVGQTDIDTVCGFLDYRGQEKLKDKLGEYKNSVEKYAKTKELDNLNDKREEFEKAMNKYFTRMERIAVLKALKGNMYTSQQTEAGKSEIICTNVNGLIEYCIEMLKYDCFKSETKKIIRYAMNTPYMLTFMHGEKEGDGYFLKNEFRKYLEDTIKSRSEQKGQANKDILNIISSSTYGIVRKSQVDSWEPLGLEHGVFRQSLMKILDIKENVNDPDNNPGAAQLLWVPPVAGKDQLKGVFEAHKDYGKTILFSRWVMVPRMIAALVSYESERRLRNKVCNIYNISNTDINDIIKRIRKMKSKSFTVVMNEQEQEMTWGEYYISPFFKKAIICAVEKEQKQDEQNLIKEDEEKQIIINAISEKFINKVIMDNPLGILAILSTQDSIDKGSIDQDAIIREFPKMVKTYCKDGQLQKVIEEWIYMQDFEKTKGNIIKFLNGTEGSKGSKGSKKDDSIFGNIKTSNINVDVLYPKEQIKDESNTTKAIKEKLKKIPNDCEDYPLEYLWKTHYARCLGMSKDDDKYSAVKNLQSAFNTPFMPFVFATTSMGQEGLDFHYYADQIIHWNLPANPVDFEQREGRIDRYNSYAIRKKLMEWYGENDKMEWYGENDKTVKEVLNQAFKKVEGRVESEITKLEKNVIQDQDRERINLLRCGMIPHWILPKIEEPDDSREVTKDIEVAKIRRVVPYFGMSETLIKYHNNLKILQLYRSVIGQPNPEELLERLFDGKNEEEKKKIIDNVSVQFSPYHKIQTTKIKKQ